MFNKLCFSVSIISLFYSGIGSAWDSKCVRENRGGDCIQRVMLATASEIIPLKNELGKLNGRLDRELARLREEKIELERLNPEIVDFIKGKTIDELLIKLKALLHENGLEVELEDL